MFIFIFEFQDFDLKRNFMSMQLSKILEIALNDQP